MREFTSAFHQQLREVFHDGQLDMFGEMDVQLPYRPGVRCKKCGIPWDGQDARQSPTEAKARGCWWVSTKRTHCAKCHQETK